MSTERGRREALRNLRNYAEGRSTEKTEAEKVAASFVRMIEEIYGEDEAQKIFYAIAEEAMLPGHRGILDRDD